MFSFTKFFKRQGLLIKEDENKGRYVVADKDFKAGETIIVGYPFSSSINDQERQTRCHFCYNLCSSLLYCSSCKNVGYCSKNCQVADWRNHKNECSRLLEHKDVHLDQDMYLIYKIIINIINKRDGQASYLEDLMSVNKTTVKGTCNDVKLLCSHEDLFGEDKPIYIEKSSNILSLFSEEDKIKFDITEEYIYNLYLSVFTNYFEISDNTDTIPIALGFYPALSLFNHSCKPNVYRFSTVNKNNEINFVAIRKIKKNEEICLNYTQIFVPTPIRKQHLMKYKHFDCLCERCTKSDFNEDICCNKRHCLTVKKNPKTNQEEICNGCCIPVYKDKYTIPNEWICNECNSKLSQDQYDEKFKDILSSLKEQFFLVEPSESIEIINNIMKILQNYLWEGNYEIESYMMPYYTHFVNIQMYEIAYIIGMYIIQNLEKGILIEGHPKIYGMYANVGILCIQLGRYLEGKRLLEKAYSNFKMIYPQNHPRLASILSGLNRANANLKVKSGRR